MIVKSITPGFRRFLFNGVRRVVIGSKYTLFASFGGIHKS